MGDLVLSRLVVTAYSDGIYEAISDNVKCFLSGTLLKKLLRNYYICFMLLQF